MVQKLYKDTNTPTDQILYFTMPDLTSDTPGTPYTGGSDNEPFVIDGDIKIYESQKTIIPITSYTIVYDADVLECLITIPASYFTQWSTGFIFFNDSRSGPIKIEFEVCYPDHYLATFSQVAAIPTDPATNDNVIAAAANIENVLTPMQTSIDNLRQDVDDSFNDVPTALQIATAFLSSMTRTGRTVQDNFRIQEILALGDITGLTNGAPVAGVPVVYTLGNMSITFITDSNKQRTNSNLDLIP